MSRKTPRAVVVILIGLAVIAGAILAVLFFAGDRITYTDEAADIEIIPPAGPPPV